jgi:multicomponent Na+:H+ antiporter subunit C
VSYLPFAVAGWLLLVGFYGVITSRNYVHLTICLMVAQSATYALLLSVGYLKNGQAPIFADINPSSKVVDPVVQALTLTDVVVEAVITALLLTLAVQAHRRFGTLDPDRMGRMHG